MAWTFTTQTMHSRGRTHPGRAGGPLLEVRFPAPAVTAWYNAYDPKDVVALCPLDAANFPVNPPVENYGRVLNGTDNRHGIIGYLDDADVAKQILDALQA
jgi:hypothetical protein